MIIVGITALVLGLAFLLFGYFIYFQKKYNLINDFKAEYQAGLKDEQYAKKVGLTELVVGAVLVISGIILLVFA